MDYHVKNRSEDGVLRMPANGYALKNIEEKLKFFKYEPHNVILSLETDGFNPFGELRCTYSMWPFFHHKQ